jgi:hypothetical protein
MAQDEPARRSVIANFSRSLDGRVAGPGGEYDMGWIVPHAVSDGARNHMVRVTGAATTALLGRKNYEARTASAPPRGTLAGVTPTETGAACVLFDRVRPVG